MKFTIAFGSRADMSPAEFRTHYEVRHAALADKVLGPKGYLRQYIQNYAIDVAAELQLPIRPLSGCSEVWFDSLQQFRNTFEDPDYHLLREDEERFVDFDNLLIALTEDVPIFGGSGRPRWKLLRFISCRDVIDRTDFEQFWHGDYVEAVSQSPEIRSVARTYIQNRPLARDQNPFPTAEIIDGVDEFWFRTPAELQQLITAERLIADRLDIGRFIKLETRWDTAWESRVVPGYEACDAMLASA